MTKMEDGKSPSAASISGISLCNSVYFNSSASLPNSNAYMRLHSVKHPDGSVTTDSFRRCPMIRYFSYSAGFHQMKRLSSVLNLVFSAGKEMKETVTLELLQKFLM